MRSTQQLSITLPNDMAEMVRAKVAAGDTHRKARSSEMACAPWRPVTRPLRHGCARRWCRRQRP